MTWEPAEASRAILARHGLSTTAGVGAEVLAEFRRVRDLVTLYAGHAELLRDVLSDLVAAEAALDTAMRRGDHWEIGNALLGVRVRVRHWAAVIDHHARKERRPELRFEFSWTLDAADSELLDFETMIARMANYQPRDLPHGPMPPPQWRPDSGRASDDRPVFTALSAAIQGLRNHLGDRGRPRDHATRLLFFMVDSIGLTAEQVPEVAAALLAVGGDDKAGFPSLVKRMRTAYDSWLASLPAALRRTAPVAE